MKSLSLLLLLASAALLHAQVSNSAPVANFGSPVIVARGRLVDQTAPVPAATMFTPAQSGLYQISAYMVQTALIKTSSAYWLFHINWVDDAGGETLAPMILYANGGILRFASDVQPMQLAAGQPVTYSIDLNDPNAQGGGTFALYFTLERLQ